MANTFPPLVFREIMPTEGQGHAVGQRREAARAGLAWQ